MSFVLEIVVGVDKDGVSLVAVVEESVVEAGCVVEFVVVGIEVEGVCVVELEFEDVVEAGFVLVVVVVGDGAEGVRCFVRFELVVVEGVVGCFVVVIEETGVGSVIVVVVVTDAVMWAGCTWFVVVTIDELRGAFADCTVRGDSEDGLADEHGNVLCRGFVGTIERSTWSERRRVCFQEELHRLKTDVVLVFHQRLQEESRTCCCESGGASEIGVESRELLRPGVECRRGDSDRTSAFLEGETGCTESTETYVDERVVATTRMDGFGDDGLVRKEKLADRIADFGEQGGMRRVVVVSVVVVVVVGDGVVGTFLHDEVSGVIMGRVVNGFKYVDVDVEGVRVVRVEVVGVVEGEDLVCY